MKRAHSYKPAAMGNEQSQESAPQPSVEDQPEWRPEDISSDYDDEAQRPVVPSMESQEFKKPVKTKAPTMAPDLASQSPKHDSRSPPTTIPQAIRASSSVGSGTKKKEKKRKKKRKSSGSVASPAVVDDRAAQAMQAMREREPETFDEYAMSEASGPLYPQDAQQEPNELHEEDQSRSPMEPAQAVQENNVEEENETAAGDVLSQSEYMLVRDNKGKDKETDFQSEAGDFNRSAEVHDTTPNPRHSSAASDTNLSHALYQTPEEWSQRPPEETDGNMDVTAHPAEVAPDLRGNDEPARDGETQKVRITTNPGLGSPKGAHDDKRPAGTKAEAAGGTLMQDQADPSSDHQSSANSVFDDVEDVEAIKETPLAKVGLKRKGDLEHSTQESPTENLPLKKKQRRSLFSPPTSVESEHTEQVGVEDLDEVQDDHRANGQSIRQKRATNRPRNSSANLDGWTKPFVPGSNLQHPLLNRVSPKVPGSSQIVSVVMPRTSDAGLLKRRALQDGTASRTHLPVVHDELDLSEDGFVYSRGKKRNAVYTSAKGKSRARAGLNYSSPSKVQPVLNTDDLDSPEGSDYEEMATSVARRTFPSARRKKTTSALRSRLSGQQNQADSDASNPEAQADSGDDHEVDGGEAESISCDVCGKPFRSPSRLKRHKTNDKSHAKLHECPVCEKGFYSKKALGAHKTSSGHRGKPEKEASKPISGKVPSTRRSSSRQNFTHTQLVGFFSDEEVNKLNRWRDQFCRMHNIDSVYFNEMMTQTSRRKEHWPYKFVDKHVLMQEFLDVLPDRDRRSMYRYRERNFQNIPSTNGWEPEDDDALITLYNEIGPRWVEIGQRLTRTQDAVSQRWRHVLQYRGRMRRGEWPAEESEQLKRMVMEVKKESDLAQNHSTDSKISWTAVSKKMNDTRTPRQCSNHWRAMHGEKRDGKYVIVPGLEKIIDGKPRPKPSTPSKMDRRLAGDSSSVSKPASRRKIVSAELVKESDNESDQDQEEQAEVDEAHSMNTEAGLEGRHGTMAPLTPGPHSKHTERQHDSALDDDPDLPPMPPPSSMLTGRKRKSSDDHGESTPRLKRNPFATRTPGQSLDMSQAFGQTQANTSAFRSVNTRMGPSQERPSPSISIQHRPVPSLMKSLSERGSDHEDERELELEDMESDVDEDISADHTQDSDELGDSYEVHNGGRDGSPEDGEEVENLAEQGQNAQPADADTDAEEDGDVIGTINGLAKDGADHKGNLDDTDHHSSNKDDVDDADTQSASEDGGREDDEADDEPGNQATQDTMVAATQNDWLKNIQEAAESSSRSAQGKVRMRALERRMVERESISESD